MSAIQAKALALFNEVVEMDESERQHALAHIHAQDARVHDELMSLLKADAERFILLEHSPLLAFPGDLPDLTDMPGRSKLGAMFGAWRAVGILGQGGMGVVYAAERSDGRHRQSAALKHIRTELSSPRVLAAFLRERDHLASLSHPGIVPLLDSGVDEQGQPWFVMRQINGQPIDLWCDQQQLSLRERVKLFLEACDAVASAHERGVLHQDIKPSNLLVTPDGRTQLLDFGLAMTLQPTSVEHHRVAMTTHYTAPEVMRGAYPGASADVYALGVLFYRLLCGQFPSTPSHPPGLLPPYDPPAPEAPSRIARRGTRQIALQRGCNGPRSLSRKLAGDLDSIALACTNADPDERYAHVARLQHDLRQWLASRPVSTRPYTWLYRTQCLLRRRKLAVVVTTCVGALLMLAAGFFGYQQVRAQQEMSVASTVDHLFEQTLALATLSSLGDQPVSPQALLERAELQLRAQSSTEPAVRARGLAVLARNWALAGDYGKARALALEASRLARDEPLQEAFDLAILAQAQNLAANFPEAEKSARQGLSKLGFDWTAQHKLARVRLETQLAAAQSGQGHAQEAQKTVDKALAEAEKLSPSISGVSIAELLIQKGDWLRNRIRVEESERDLVRAVSLAEPIDPVVTDNARESLMRTIRASHRPDREKRSLILAQQLLSSRQHSLGMIHPLTGAAWAELAFAQMLNEDNAAAKVSIDQAESILKQSVDAQHPALARAYMAKANLETLEGRLDEGMMWTSRALDIYRNRYGPNHELTLGARFLLADQYWWKSSANGDGRDQDKARNLIGAAIEDSVATYGEVWAIHRIAYATLLANAGMRPQAGGQLMLARSDIARQYGPKSEEMLHVRLAEASFLIDSHADGSRIRQALDSLIVDARQVNTTYVQSIEYTALLEQARWLQAQNRLDDARVSLRQAGEVADAAHEPIWKKNVLEKMEYLDNQVRRKAN